MFRVANWLLLAGLLFVGIACEADPNSFETEGHYPADSLYARMGEQLELEAQLQQEMAESEDFIEGVSAFIQKRPANFSGR